MKQIAILFLSSLITLSAIGQKSKVTTAKFALDEGKLDKAKQAIDLASVHEKTESDPKTWHYRGLIYKAIYNDQGAYKDLDSNALEKAHEAFLKSMELDEKGKYKETNLLLGIDFVRFSYAMKGDKERENGDYEKSYNSYSISAAMNKMLREGLGEEMIPVDTTINFLLAYSAQRIGKTDEAKQYYDELVAMQFELELLYSTYSSLLLREKSYDKCLDIVRKGQAIHPANTDLIITELNVYLALDKGSDAIERFETAISLDSTNFDLYFALGTIYDKLKDKEEAEDAPDLEIVMEYRNKMVAAYQNTIRLNPEHFKANYNLGVLYYNEAANLAKEMESLPLSEKKKYDAMKEEWKALNFKALPYFVSAHASDATNIDAVRALKEIYFRFHKTNEDFNTKYEEMKAKLEALEQ